MSIEEIFSPDKIYITVAVLAVIGLFFVSSLIGVTIRRRQRQVMTSCRFRPRKRLMDSTERRCFQLLDELFGQKFYIIPQVALSALLNPKVGTQDFRAASQFIENRSVDFVLCNKRTLRPICAVKLGDAQNSGTKVSSKIPGSTPQDMRQFFRSAHLPFVYLQKPQHITRQQLIDEFSRVIYETSKSK